MKTQLLTLLTVTSVLAGCGASSSSSTTKSSNNLCDQLNSSSFSCKQMLSDIEGQQKGRIQNFSTQLNTLKTDMAAYCAAIGSAQESAARSTARASWQVATQGWQQLEVMQFGVITSDVRNDFYSWPLSKGKTCNIDNDIASLANGGGFSTTPQKRGLSAIEYILFADAPLSSCSSKPAAASNAASRCAFGKAAVDLMATQAAALKTASDASDLSKSADLRTEAQKVFNALFYVYTETKGDKLQKAIFPTNVNDTFKPQNLEFSFANMNRAAVEANLQGSQAVFSGGNGQGLADMLTAAGQGALATQMEAALKSALEAAASSEFTTSWRAVLTTAEADRADNDVADCINSTASSTGSEIIKLCALDKKIAVFTDDLKNRAALTLNLTVPGSAESDGD